MSCWISRERITPGFRNEPVIGSWGGLESKDCSTVKRMSIILFVLLFALGTRSAFAGDLSGVITETKCGAAHKAGTDKDISCIKSCAKSGAGKLALLAGDTLYTITNPEKATGHEGHTVKVTGKTDESAKTVTIDSIEMAAK
jgi:hypothetical protein